MSNEMYDTFIKKIKTVPGQELKAYATGCSSTEAITLLASSIVLNQHPKFDIDIVHIDVPE